MGEFLQSIAILTRVVFKDSTTRRANEQHFWASELQKRSKINANGQRELGNWGYRLI
jgi:hypothetical protein